MTPVFLTIAGSDSSAGAGVQADLKTGCALGCYPLTAVTCVVSEVPGRVAALCPMEPDFVVSQVQLAFEAFPVAALKTGMLYSPQIVRAVAEILPPGVPLVVDPVMVATAGADLMLSDTLAAYTEHLFPRAALLTPNKDELLRLTSGERIESVEEQQAAALELAARFSCAVLAKGGHMPGAVCTDVLAMPDGSTRLYTHARTPGIPTHGTGCTLSAAVTAHLAHGLPLEQAVEHALSYTAESIAHSFNWGATYALAHNSGIAH